MGQQVSTNVTPEEKTFVAPHRVLGRSVDLKDISLQSQRTDVSARSSILSASANEEASSDDFNEKYAVDSVLGFGASANVYEVYNKKTWERLACKEIKISGSVNDAHTIKTEIEAFRRSNHPNVVRLHEAFESDSKAWLVLELVQGGDLVSALARLPVYSERAIATLFRQMLLGVKHLHEQGIVHRDIKIKNFLCTKPAQVPTDEVTAQDLTVKVTDFGLSAVSWDWQPGCSRPSKAARHLKEMWGTTEYFAPEVYARAYGFQADVWSLGCVLFELLTGHLAFPSRDLRVPVVDRLLVHGLRKPRRAFEQRAEWSQLSAQARSLIKGMLRRDPARRMDLDACLAHPWIADGAQMAQTEASAGLGNGLGDREIPRVQKVFRLWAKRNAGLVERRCGEFFSSV